MPDKNVPQKETSGKAAKIASALTSVLLVFAMAFCGLIVYRMKVNGYASIAGYSVFCVLTGSMEPTLSEGELVVSKETDFSEVQVGDIICFRSLESFMFGKPVTHRVIAEAEYDGKRVLRTRGDANNSEDGFYVTEDNYIGKVISHTEKDGAITVIYSILKSKTGFFTLIGLPVMLIVFLILKDNMKKIKADLKEMREELDRQEEKNDEAKPSSEQADAPAVAEEEYSDMVARIRAELLREMQGGATPDHESKEESPVQDESLSGEENESEDGAELSADVESSSETLAPEEPQNDSTEEPFSAAPDETEGAEASAEDGESMANGENCAETEGEASLQTQEKTES